MGGIAGEHEAVKVKELKITIGHLPYSALMPNRLRGSHWSVRSRISLVALSEAYSEARLCMGDWEPPEKASILYRFTVQDRRKRDLDNLIGASKPFLDGLVSARVIASDDGMYLSVAGAEMVRGTEAKTELIISRREG